MRQPLLLTLLLAGLIGLAAPAQAHGRHGHQAHVKPFVQVVPWPDGYWQDYMLRPWRMVPPMARASSCHAQSAAHDALALPPGGLLPAALLPAVLPPPPPAGVEAGHLCPSG
jgi:hypothetical protein